MAENTGYMEQLAPYARALLKRLDRIHAECCSPLGYAQRGVASWDQDWLERWRAEATKGIKWGLSQHEEAILQRIERQVFG